ncbi:MAG: lactoylglutathione lyase [Methyloligella sp.]|nr:MAG: lactoylglutathione lyase [Methyloligella sp.]
MPAKMIHTMIRVLSEETSVNFYQSAFNLTIAERLDFDDFTLIYMSNEEQSFELELTINKSQTTPYEHGTGYGHLAFVVDDLESEHQRLSSLGLSPKDIVNFNHEQKALAKFFFIEDPDGYKIEVLQKLGRFR